MLGSMDNTGNLEDCSVHHTHAQVCSLKGHLDRNEHHKSSQGQPVHRQYLLPKEQDKNYRYLINILASPSFLTLYLRHSI